MKFRAVLFGICFALIAPEAFAQRPPASVEGLVGYAGFTDESTDHHLAMGAAGRVYISPRLSAGPEVTYMRGPASDRDLFVTGNLTFDFVAPGTSGEPSRLVPYLIAGGGIMRHSNDFGGETFSSTEGAFTTGLGVRISLNDRFYIAPEARIGWELHGRVGVSLGWRP